MVMSLFAVAGCGGDSGTNGGGGGGAGVGGGGITPVAGTAVEVDDNVFTPPDIVVTSGATVTWTWVGTVGHNVTFASTAVSSSITQATGSFLVTMPMATGVYTYRCTIHPGMDGSVTVQ